MRCTKCCQSNLQERLAMQTPGKPETKATPPPLQRAFTGGLVFYLPVGELGMYIIYLFSHIPTSHASTKAANLSPVKMVPQHHYISNTCFRMNRSNKQGAFFLQRIQCDVTLSGEHLGFERLPWIWYVSFANSRFGLRIHRWRPMKKWKRAHHVHRLSHAQQDAIHLRHRKTQKTSRAAFWMTF